MWRIIVLLGGILLVLFTGWYIWIDIAYRSSPRDARLATQESSGLGLTREEWESPRRLVGREGDGFVGYGYWLGCKDLRVIYAFGRIWSLEYTANVVGGVDLQHAREVAKSVMPRDAIRISKDASSDIEKGFWMAEPGTPSEEEHTEVYRSHYLSRLSDTGDSSSPWSVGETGIFTVTYRMGRVVEVTSPPVKWKVFSTLIEVRNRQ